MSDLLAPVLCELRDEVAAFWCFVGLMQRAVFVATPTDRDMDRSLKYLRELVRIMVPKFHEHLQNHKDAAELLFCHRWILFHNHDIVSNNSSNVMDEGDNHIRELMLIDTTDFNVKPDLNINSDLDFVTKEQIYDLVDDYLTCPKPEHPEIDFECRLTVKPTQPIAFRPRRLSFEEKNKLQAILDDLIERQVIRESCSPFCSPIVLLKKKNGIDYRLCVDFRELNKVTEKDRYPLPLIDDQLDLLRNKNYFTCLDLKNGFHHIKMAEESVKYTSFITQLGQFEFLRMPFGICNGPSVFSRYINKIFKDLIKEKKITIYLDDILIATEDIPEHLEILKRVLRIMSQNLLELRQDKCSFMRRNTIYLGYLIDNQGIKPDPENVRAVREYPIPDTAQKVRRFLGLASYFRRFVPSFAVVAKPLSDLTRKASVFRFGEPELNAFNAIKEKLVKAPILSIYSPELETEVHCDACTKGYGAILLQKQKDNHFRPVSYYSRRTTDAEAKFHSYELEMLAIVNALNRFHVYLHGIKFKIVTDCNAVKLALNKKEINPKINRWALILQNYLSELEHREGNKMRHVDALSRVNSILILEENTFEQNLAVTQNLDPVIKELKIGLQISENKSFELRNGVVYKKVKDKILFYVREITENQVIQNCHDNLGHPIKR
ncbi:Rab-GTPase-TBC domain [Popillia japonica]|uniref:RNA-directed DNA polymerase n=1 Tax=Popillia japonica TaxID=7064 RepID=A0AAW1KRM0_POPJA